MDKISQAVQQIQRLNELAAKDCWINRIHPISKLLIMLFYCVLVVSFDKYHFVGLLVMAIYPLIMYEIASISILKTLYRLKILLLFIALFGIFNPFFDDKPLIIMQDIVITGGMVSMLTLLIKGILSLLASYLLIATTSIEGICYALKKLYVPKILVTQILLLYRYIPLFLLEVKHTLEAYSLKTMQEHGIRFRTWGSLVGLILLRSLDRANEVYQSMCIRGYRGEFYAFSTQKMMGRDVAYLLIWAIVLLILRFVSVSEIIGEFLI